MSLRLESAPLELAVPTLVIDTADGYRPEWDDVVGFANQ
jgi:hypothetical protein